MLSDRYPEVLRSIQDHLVSILIGKGVDKTIADESAEEAVENIRINFGGEMVYIGKGKAYDINKRDARVWNDFNGKNHKELCRKYDISIQQVYKIIKAKRLLAVSE